MVTFTSRSVYIYSVGLFVFFFLSTRLGLNTTIYAKINNINSIGLFVTNKDDIPSSFNSRKKYFGKLKEFHNRLVDNFLAIGDQYEKLALIKKEEMNQIKNKFLLESKKAKKLETKIREENLYLSINLYKYQILISNCYNFYKDAKLLF